MDHQPPSYRDVLLAGMVKQDQCAIMRRALRREFVISIDNYYKILRARATGLPVRGIPIATPALAPTPALVYQPHGNPARRTHAMAQAHRGGESQQ